MSFLMAVVLELFFWLSTRDYIRSSSVTPITKHGVGLVLGTSRLTKDGQPNTFFEGRMLTAAKLYNEKWVDCLLLSGDNTTLSYNEPIDMQRRLQELGIPPERIYLDYAGVRTLDSVLRARDIFGLSEVVIVSQEFHLQRAVLLARASGLKATGYAASEVSFWIAPIVYARAIASQAVALYDIVFETDARFAGERIEIDTRADVRPVPAKTCAPRE
jgi:SanA protein